MARPETRRKALRKHGLFLCRVTCVLLLSIPHLFSQALPAGELRADVAAFVTGTIANTQLPNFADNALGFSAGLFLQRSPLLGLEGRFGVYPARATYFQAPVTTGVRISPFRPRPLMPTPYAYFGGGFSKSQYEKVNLQPSAALWAPCWQSVSGMDIGLHKLSWRIYEASWTETYTLRGSLRTLSLSTGLVYSFIR
jgi:hypothetical protein